MVMNRSWTAGMRDSEDWWAVWLGLVMFAAGLVSLGGVDLVGWMAKTKTWTDLGEAVVVSGKTYGDWNPWAALVMTYAVFTGLTCAGARSMGLDVG
ncbi:MAG: putative sulfate exporter family transporter, partial [Alphaproteobacteria bacterium]|nr:putative sulfate exporter family transporter [Alphaproteobacteria bacterium]